MVSNCVVYYYYFDLDHLLGMSICVSNTKSNGLPKLPNCMIEKRNLLQNRFSFLVASVLPTILYNAKNAG